jgi:hypothetical protein
MLPYLLVDLAHRRTPNFKIYGNEIEVFSGEVYTNTKLNLGFEINLVIRCLQRGSVKCYSQHDHHK